MFKKGVSNAIRVFTFKNKVLVQPHLQYAVQFWSPNPRKNITRVEIIQVRATKIIPELHNISYERSFQQLELISLVQRRLRGQLIKAYKFLDGFNDVTLEVLFDRDENVRTRNNGQKLVINFKTYCEKYRSC
ncbi:hypothetical protein FHG87_002299 [Trinorchestia longiramus]|nr:hypothetical protein FHG87_002299 [Trinorchestia longiramus]